MHAHTHTQVHFVLLPHPPGECLSRETGACLNELYSVSVQKVTAGDQTWSVSCPSCPCSLCSPLVSTSSPPTTATNMWTYLTRSALPCVVLSASTYMFVVGIYCTCVWRALYMCVFAYMYICVCIAIVHIRTVLIFAICYIQSFMVACKTAKRFVKSHDHHMDQWSHLPLSCGLYSPQIRGNH